MAANPFLIICLVLWALAHAADILSTLSALKHGNHEANSMLVDKQGKFSLLRAIVFKVWGLPLIMVGWYLHLPWVTVVFAGALTVPAMWAAWHNWRLAR